MGFPEETDDEMIETWIIPNSEILYYWEIDEDERPN